MWVVMFSLLSAHQLRHTHVQDGEAGGITQQIGATNVPQETILEQTKMVKNVSVSSDTLSFSKLTFVFSLWTRVLLLVWQRGREGSWDAYYWHSWARVLQVKTRLLRIMNFQRIKLCAFNVVRLMFFTSVTWGTEEVLCVTSPFWWWTSCTV